MKLCGICKTDKDESLFGKRSASLDGLSNKCKACQKAYDSARSKDEYRKAQRAIYAQTDEGKLAGDKAKAEYRKRNPVKAKAHAIVARSIRSGKLFKLPCEICRSEEIIHAHHDDYAKPLNVRWLCPMHHQEWHDKNGEGLNAR